MNSKNERSALHGLKAKVILIVCAVLAYAASFEPTRFVLGFGLRALGYPSYAGFKGILLPHLLLYSTMTAVCCAVLWYLLVRSKLLAPPVFRTGSDVIRQGLAGGIVGLLVVLATTWFLAPAGTIHWIDPVPWKIAGNVFSNFYEEFIFRGFMLAVLTAILGFWPAALISSALWGMSHTQYPLPFRIMVSGIGIYWCWICRRAKSIWAPYTSHMVLDIVADSLIG